MDTRYLGNEISVIIPVFNEERNLFPLYERLKNVLINLDREYEIIFVDDGSKDKSFAVLREIKDKDPNIKIIKFKRNYGQSFALDAGFRNAQGEIIVSLDADLQNDPEDIPKLLKELASCDVVCGWRKKRFDPLSKKISSWIANFIRRLVLRDKFLDIGCTLRVYRREALEKIKLFNGLHRFLPILIEYEGFKVKQIVVKHHPRFSGKSKYKFFRRLIKPFIDLLVVYWMKRNWIRYEYEII
ncbi:MAG: glycosyltransferase family 2 protein [Candidatus Omnitrophica bacterium]|nr:glycosyltransferase family 2 protein [Candidatus Omnitrophota bacterium]MCM8793211.1 glycosyltransferase family 2 protein [Candidatus Omnitrophota bacterium]